MKDVRILAIAAVGGDLEAYEELVLHYRETAHRYAVSIVRDHHLAEDVVQEAFVTAYLQLPSLREPRAFPGWFRRIVFKHCDRMMRRRKGTAVCLDGAREMPSPAGSPADRAEAREIVGKVMAAIRRLPRKEREVTTLYYIEGRSQKDISGILGVPVTSVNNRLYASRKRLRRIWQVSEEEFARKTLENMDIWAAWPERERQGSPKEDRK